MYAPAYVALVDSPYNFDLDISKIGGGSTDIRVFIRTVLMYLGTIRLGFWCNALEILVLAPLGIGLHRIYKGRCED